MGIRNAEVGSRNAEVGRLLMWKRKLVEFGSWYDRLEGLEGKLTTDKILRRERNSFLLKLLDELLVEADELIAIFTSIGKKAK